MFNYADRTRMARMFRLGVIGPLFCAILALSVGTTQTVHATESNPEFAKGLQFFKAGQFGKAKELWSKCAAQGMVKAQYRLGTLYEYGKGVQKDLVEAHLWYSLASEYGDDFAERARFRVEKSMSDEQILSAQLLLAEFGPIYSKSRVEGDASRDEDGALTRQADDPAQAGPIDRNTVVASMSKDGSKRASTLSANEAGQKREKLLRSSGPGPQVVDFSSLTPSRSVTRPDVAKLDVSKKDVAENNVAKNNVAKNDVAKNDAAKNDAAKNDAAKNDAAKNDAAKNDVAKNDGAKQQGVPGETIKSGIAKQYPAQSRGDMKAAAEDTPDVAEDGRITDASNLELLVGQPESPLPEVARAESKSSRPVDARRANQQDQAKSGTTLDINRGSSNGDGVRRIQRMLIELGYKIAAVDGLVGPNTRAAIKAFRQDMQLSDRAQIDVEFLAALYKSHAAINK